MSGNKRAFLSLLVLLFSVVILFLLVSVLVVFSRNDSESRRETTRQTMSVATPLVYSSKFTSNQYNCEGSCFCEGEEERRSGLTKSLLVGVSAVSMISAYKVANARFDEECDNVFRGQCEENIVSSIGSCELVVSSYEESNQPHGEVKNVLLGFGKKEDKKFVACRGHCMENKALDRLHRDPGAFIPSHKLGLVCENMVQDVVTEIYNAGQVTSEYIFVETVLNPWCAQQSELQATTEFYNSYLREKMEEALERFKKEKEEGHPLAEKRMVAQASVYVSRCLGFPTVTMMDEYGLKKEFHNVKCTVITEDEYNEIEKNSGRDPFESIS